MSTIKNHVACIIGRMFDNRVNTYRMLGSPDQANNISASFGIAYRTLTNSKGNTMFEFYW